MIRHAITEAELRARIAIEDAGWHNRTQVKTKACRTARKFLGGSDWSSIKAAYMKLQHEKCCFCERRMESTDYGRVEQDVEHFRPKGTVRDWLTAEVRQDLGLGPREAARQASAKGYYLLAYHPFNYAAACKPCNSTLKSDYFPVLGRRCIGGHDPRKIATERPLLIYPIGDIDEDPEQLIRFEGIIAMPAQPAGNRERYLRGRSTIKFFQLNRGDGRENLIRERAEVIDSLWKSLRLIELNGDAAEVHEAKLDLTRMASAAQPHANCCRSFLRIYGQDRASALLLWQSAKKYLQSQQSTPTP